MVVLTLKSFFKRLSALKFVGKMNPFLSPHIFVKGGFVGKNNPTTVSAVPNEVFWSRKNLLDDSCCGSPQPRGQDATERDRRPGDLFFDSAIWFKKEKRFEYKGHYVCTYIQKKKIYIYTYYCPAANKHGNGHQPHSNSKYIYFLKDRLLVWGSVISIKGNQPPTKINPTRLFF